VNFETPVTAWVRGASLALMLWMTGGKACAQGIIHIVPPQPLYYSDSSPGQIIDVNNDGVADFNLSGGQDIDLNPLNNNAILSVPEGPLDLGVFIYALSQGECISSSLDPGLVWYDRDSPYGGTAGIVSCANIGCLGCFAYNTNAYAGIRLEVGGSVYYGWIHVQNLFGSNWGQVSDWAYETSPNTPIVAGAGADSDHDSVWDYLDQCPCTPAGAVVDTNGCSIAQLCPCEGPWKNHGEYVKAVQSVAARFVQEGRITEQQRAAIVKQAANSDCGKVR